MIFICSFIFLFVLFIIFMLMVAGGFIVFSRDKAVTVEPAKAETKKAELKAYIDLSGNFIELFTKAEETKAKRDGFKVVYK